MKYRRRIFLTDAQKSEIWNRWQRGESMSSIGRRFDRSSSSIYPLLERTGGIRPPERRISRLALTLVDCEEISRGLIAKQSLRSMARAAFSDEAAWDCAHRPKPCKLVGNDYLSRAISAKLTRK